MYKPTINSCCSFHCYYLSTSISEKHYYHCTFSIVTGGEINNNFDQWESWSFAETYQDLAAVFFLHRVITKSSIFLETGNKDRLLQNHVCISLELPKSAFVGLYSRLFTRSVLVWFIYFSFAMSYKEANDVLNYWFGGGDRSKRPRWFRGGEEAAQEIRDKFEMLVS